MRYALYSYSGRTAEEVLVVGKSVKQIREFICAAERLELGGVQGQLIAYPEQPSTLRVISADDPERKRLGARGEKIVVDWSLIGNSPVPPAETGARYFASKGVS